MKDEGSEITTGDGDALEFCAQMFCCCLKRFVMAERHSLTLWLASARLVHLRVVLRPTYAQTALTSQTD